MFQLLQALRMLPAPVTATRLAQETGVSLRSLYRDIDSLRAAGAAIEGERGYGYRLVEDGALPPQMFDRIEIEALVLGLGEVAHMGDPALAKAAASVLAKVTATLPDRHQQHLHHAVSQVRRYGSRYPAARDMSVLRAGCWHEEAVTIRYADQHGAATERAIWPLAIVYLEAKLVVLAWCCLRRDFRMFRADRIEAATPEGTSFRPQRVALLRTYVAKMRESRADRREAEREPRSSRVHDPATVER